jgi:hypothetical protein
MSYTRVLGNEVMADMLGADSDYAEQAEALKERLPYWTERSSYLYVPNWNLI